MLSCKIIFKRYNNSTVMVWIWIHLSPSSSVPPSPSLSLSLSLSLSFSPSPPFLSLSLSVLFQAVLDSLSVSDVSINWVGWTTSQVAPLVSFSCNVEIEDEYHVLLKCGLYDHIRLTYTEDQYRTPINLNTFNQLLSFSSAACVCEIM